MVKMLKTLVLACLAAALILSGCAEKAPDAGNNTPADTPEVTSDTVDDIEDNADDDSLTDEVADDSEEPAVEGPMDYPLDEETTALANEIIDGLNADMALARDILSGNMLESASVRNGVDEYGNLLFIDVVDDDGMEYTQTFIPFQEPYDTVENIMEVMRRVYTEKKCEQIRSDYFADNRYIKEIGGRLYHAMTEAILTPFNQPFLNAVRISDDEILAITTISYDDGDYHYEITFKNEDGEWKIDRMVFYSDVIGWKELDY